MSHAAGIDRGKLPDVLLQDLDRAIVVAERDVDARFLGDLRQLGDGERIAGVGVRPEPVWIAVPGAGAAISGSARVSPAGALRNTGAGGAHPALPARVVPARASGAMGLRALHRAGGSTGGPPRSGAASRR